MGALLLTAITFAWLEREESGAGFFEFGGAHALAGFAMFLTAWAIGMAPLVIEVVASLSAVALVCFATYKFVINLAWQRAVAYVGIVLLALGSTWIVA